MVPRVVPKTVRRIVPIAPLICRQGCIKRFRGSGGCRAVCPRACRWHIARWLNTRLTSGLGRCSVMRLFASFTCLRPHAHASTGVCSSKSCSFFTAFKVSSTTLQVASKDLPVSSPREAKSRTCSAAFSQVITLKALEQVASSPWLLHNSNEVFKECLSYACLA